jgi:hypothetical protein
MPKKDHTTNKNHISHLFLRHKERLTAPEATVVRECIVVVREATGLTLTPNQVLYKVPSKTLHFLVPGPIKTEIKIKQRVILDTLRSRLGERAAPTTII